MVDNPVAPLANKRLLVVEDEYLIAADLAFKLERAGAEVVGPAGTVEDALDLLRAEGGRLDGALLDVNLSGERVFPVADALAQHGIPFIFATGYDASIIPPAHAGVPRHEKPVDWSRLLRELAARIA